MAAWPPAQRLSLERVRLRPHGAAGAGADGFVDRPLGTDVPERRDFRQSRRADRWPFARAQALDCARRGARGAGRDGDFRRGPPGARADPDGRQCQPANHAAQPAAGPEIQLRRQGGGHAQISDAVGPGVRAAIHGRSRRQHSDLAGVGVSLFPDTGSRCDGADRRFLAERHGADCRLGARPGYAPWHPHNARL